MSRSTNSQLSKSLDRYAAQASATSVDKKKVRRWAAYAAVAGAAGAAETRSEAAIIYSGVQNQSVQLTSPAVVNGSATTNLAINMDGIGFNDVGFEIRRISSTTTLRHDASVTSGQPMITSGVIVRNLTNGAVISAAQIFGSASGLLLNETNAGLFPKGASGLMGVKFNNGGGTMAPHFYGWLRIRLDDIAGGAGDGPDKITVIDWAYEDTLDTPIMAGAVPEPGTASLALLAGGFLGVAAYRKRRRQLAQQAAVATSA